MRVEELDLMVITETSGEVHLGFDGNDISEYVSEDRLCSVVRLPNFWIGPFETRELAEEALRKVTP